MSEIVGTFFKGALPVEVTFHLRKVDDSEWELIYGERVDLPPKLFDESKKQTLNIIKKIFPDANIKFRKDWAIFKFRGKREDIMSYLAGEFIVQSPFGKTTLIELLMLYNMGRVKLEEIKK